MRLATQWAVTIIIPVPSSAAINIDPTAIVITPKTSPVHRSHQILSLSCKAGGMNPDIATLTGTYRGYQAARNQQQKIGASHVGEARPEQTEREDLVKDNVGSQQK